jgi:hypothetical protein
MVFVQCAETMVSGGFHLKQLFLVKVTKTRVFGEFHKNTVSVNSTKTMVFGGFH